MNTPESMDRRGPSFGPMQIAENCWLVSSRNPGSLLQCNTYLRRFPGEGNGVNVCVDPGSQWDETPIVENIQGLVGDGGVTHITINHQDPDVTGNLSVLCQSNPESSVVLTEDTWRLLQHLRIRPYDVRFPLPMVTRRERLAGMAEWQPVPTPFCHFRGAMAWFDPESRTLFSGDLFGGLNQLGRAHLFAEESDWAGIVQFHQIYMPTREVLRFVIRQLRTLSPGIEAIAPQHGHVITGDLVPLFMERMEELLVGHDLLMLELDERYAAEYREAVLSLIEYATSVMGTEEVEERLTGESDDHELSRGVRLVSGEWQVGSSPFRTAAVVFAKLAAGEEEEFITSLRNQVFHFCSDRGIPAPQIGWGTEGGSDER